jgi:hypothetical protein
MISFGYLVFNVDPLEDEELNNVADLIILQDTAL